MDARQFGRRLRELREAAGLSQKELADRMGVQQTAVSWWERGRREPSFGNAVKLAEALGVNVLAFLEEPAPVPRKGKKK